MFAAGKMMMGGGGYAVGGEWFSTRIRLVVDHTKVSTSDQTDFPMLVSLTGLSGIATNGVDLRFTLVDGTLLSREVENYASGTLVAWVKIPTLSCTVDTVLYMYFGSITATEPAANSAYGSQRVWSNGYAGVWHLKETGTNPQVFDSTANANNSTAQTWTPTASGKIGRGGSFNGTSNSIQLGVPSSLSFAGSSADKPFSVSSWYYGTGTVLNRGDAGSGGLEEYSLGDLTLNIYDVVGSRQISATVSSPPPSGQWNHICATYSGSGLNTGISIYINGAIQSVTRSSQGSYALMRNVSTQTNFGSFGTTGIYKSFFNGTIDETHVASGVRSASWIATEYANQNSPSTFVAIG